MLLPKRPFAVDLNPAFGHYFERRACLLIFCSSQITTYLRYHKISPFPQITLEIESHCLRARLHRLLHSGLYAVASPHNSMEGESGGQTVVADNTNSQVDGVSLQHWAEITCLLENSIVRSDCTVCHNLAKRGGGVDFRDLLLAANSACRSCLVVCFALRHFDSPGRQRFTRIIVYASPFGSITLYAAGYTCINFYVEPNEQNEAYTMTGEHPSYHISD